jgi:valyl-tRNA synthetase
MPRTDQAGIETQVRGEKMLALEYWKTRQNMTREEFLEHGYALTREYGGSICSQLRLIGSSLDWERYFFTLDEMWSVDATVAFVRLYENGKIYRAERLVNWDFALKTAIPDAEMECV